MTPLTVIAALMVVGYLALGAMTLLLVRLVGRINEIDRSLATLDRPAIPDPRPTQDPITARGVATIHTIGGRHRQRQAAITYTPPTDPLDTAMCICPQASHWSRYPHSDCPVHRGQ